MLAISGSLILDTPNDLMLKADTNTDIPTVLSLCVILDSMYDGVKKTHNNT